jgi:hypothetical protein
MGRPVVELTQELLKKQLEYNSETGDFRWLVDKNRVLAGSIAGNIRVTGYRRIRVLGRQYAAHRLAWFYVTGEWPSGWIDHIDCDPTNNAFANLRLATPSQNSANSRKRNPASGFKGVHKSTNGYWQARIRINRKLHYLGHFSCPVAANKAYADAASQLYGAFARSD